jgi:hypothetical protein
MSDLDVHMAGDLIVVTNPETNFVAIYHKPTREPWLKLKQRTETKDHALLARAWRAANDKAWIVLKGSADRSRRPVLKPATIGRGRRD